MKFQDCDTKEVFECDAEDVESLVTDYVDGKVATIITFWPKQYRVIKHPEQVAADIGIEF